MDFSYHTFKELTGSMQQLGDGDLLSLVALPESSVA